MIGRSRELKELIRAWARVAPRTTGKAHTVVITGSPGVGKTRLVASALESFSPCPSAVFSGTARVHAPAPYDWLAAILAGHAPVELPIPPDALGWLAQHPDVPSQRYAPDALLRLAVRAVRALVGDGPAVLVVEDLHALDPASLNLVGELATTSNLSALLVVTSRPPDTAVSPRLAARTLARLVRRARARSANICARCGRSTSARFSPRRTRASASPPPRRTRYGSEPPAIRTGSRSCSPPRARAAPRRSPPNRCPPT